MAVLRQPLFIFLFQTSARRWQSFSYHYFFYVSKEFQGVGSPSENIAFNPSLQVFLLTLLEQCKAFAVLLLTLLEQDKVLAVLLQPPEFTLLKNFQGVGSPSATVSPLLKK